MLNNISWVGEPTLVWKIGVRCWFLMTRSMNHKIAPVTLKSALRIPLDMYFQFSNRRFAFSFPVHEWQQFCFFSKVSFKSWTSLTDKFQCSFFLHPNQQIDCILFIPFIWSIYDRCLHNLLKLGKRLPNCWGQCFHFRSSRVLSEITGQSVFCQGGCYCEKIISLVLNSTIITRVLKKMELRSASRPSTIYVKTITYIKTLRHDNINNNLVVNKYIL